MTPTTQAEAAAALRAGAANTNSELITIRRDQLLLALGPDPDAKESHDPAAPAGEPAAEV